MQLEEKLCQHIIKVDEATPFFIYNNHIIYKSKPFKQIYND